MSKLIQASGAAAAATMASRILGFARETVYAGFYGDTAVASAFVAAFTIPNLFRRLLGEGALTSVFVPVFIRREKEEGPEAALRGGAAVVIAVAGLCCPTRRSCAWPPCSWRCSTPGATTSCRRWARPP